MSFDRTRYADAIGQLFPNAVFGKDVLLRDDGAGPFIAQWNLASPQPTDAEFDAALAQIPATQLLAKQVAAKAMLDIDTTNSRTLRGLIGLVVSENNILRAWIVSFEAATAAATTLADLKTRVAALATTPPRTQLQVVSAIKTAIDQES